MQQFTGQNEMTNDLKLPKYRCHKVVQAAKILAVKSFRSSVIVDTGNTDAWLEIPEELLSKVDVGGYIVVYEDGYMSYSPEKPFSEGYTRIDDNPQPALTRWRRKPIEVSASQWFKNGDHPLDYSKVHSGLDNDQLRDFLPSERKANGWEGDIVRYFRSPDVSGDKLCIRCRKIMHVHGWIDTLDGGHIVCPGDWIITGVQGEFYPCKPGIFNATYEPAEIDLNAADFSDALMWLKEGKRVARRGWNAGGQFCWMVPEGQYPARMEAIKGYYSTDIVPYGAYFALKNAQDVVVPWVPSVGDLLATDWMVVV